MGRDHSEISNSIVSLENIEIDRLRVSPKGNIRGNNKQHLDVEDVDDFDTTLNHACGDLIKDAYEEGVDHLCCDLDAVPHKRKSHSVSKKKVDKPSEKLITPSKLCVR